MVYAIPSTRTKSAQCLKSNWWWSVCVAQQCEQEQQNETKYCSSIVGLIPSSVSGIYYFHAHSCWMIYCIVVGVAPYPDFKGCFIAHANHDIRDVQSWAQAFRLSHLAFCNWDLSWSNSSSAQVLMRPATKCFSYQSWANHILDIW